MATSSTLGVPSPRTLQVTSRIAAAVLGGYAFVWGFVTFGVALGVSAGMEYAEAQTLLYLLAFIVYLICSCWALAVASLARAWAVLAGGGALMTFGAWLLVRMALLVS